MNLWTNWCQNGGRTTSYQIAKLITMSTKSITGRLKGTCFATRTGQTAICCKRMVGIYTVVSGLGGNPGLIFRAFNFSIPTTLR